MLIDFLVTVEYFLFVKVSYILHALFLQNAKGLLHESYAESDYKVISLWNKTKHTSYYSGAKTPTKTSYQADDDLISITQFVIVIGTQGSSYSIIAAAFQRSVPC